MFRLPEGDLPGPAGPDDYEIDLRPAMECWREVGALLDRLVAAPETIEVLREKILGALDPLNKLVAVRCEVIAADGANRSRIIYEPSPWLAEILTALRAADLEALRQHLGTREDAA